MARTAWALLAHGAAPGMVFRPIRCPHHLETGLEAPVDAHRELLQIGQSLAHEGHPRRHGRTFLKDLAGPGEGEERLGAGGQLAGLEQPALHGPLHRAADVGHPAEGKAHLRLEQRTGLVHPGE